MTINTNFTAYSVSTLRLSITPTSTSTAATTAPTSSQDRVTVSPEATVAAGAAETTTPDPEVGSPSGSPDSPSTPVAGGRAASLLAALDGDRDGSITRQEFTAAASALLRRDAPARANDEGRGRRGVPGLERRLEKAFDRIDGNRDGAVDAAELTAVFARRDQRDGGDVPTPAAAGVMVTYVRVTSVSIAVQRYSALQPSVMTPPTEPAVPAAPAATTEGAGTSGTGAAPTNESAAA